MASITELLLLGKGSDLSSERGVSCTGELPASSDPHLVERAKKARAALGKSAMILGHHYQRDEVIDFADITVRRNAFGRQVDSFESDIAFDDGSDQLIRAVFIRAPWVEKVSDTVQVLASIDSHPVAVRSKTALATSFHPEITGDNRIHRYFIEQVAQPALLKVK